MGLLSKGRCDPCPERTVLPAERNDLAAASSAWRCLASAMAARLAMFE